MGNKLDTWSKLSETEKNLSDTGPFQQSIFAFYCFVFQVENCLPFMRLLFYFYGLVLPGGDVFAVWRILISPDTNPAFLFGLQTFDPE